MIRRVDKRVTGGALPPSSSRSIVRSEQRHSRANSRFVRNSSFCIASDICALRLRYRLRGMAGDSAPRSAPRQGIGKNMGRDYCRFRGRDRRASAIATRNVAGFREISRDARPKPRDWHSFANFFFRLVVTISAMESLLNSGKTSASARHIGPPGGPPPSGRLNLNRLCPLASQITRIQ